MPMQKSGLPLVKGFYDRAPRPNAARSSILSSTSMKGMPPQSFSAFSKKDSKSSIF